MPKISSFKSIESKRDLCKGNDCMEMFYKSLRRHAMKIINLKKKKNEVIIKRTSEIIRVYTNLLYL